MAPAQTANSSTVKREFGKYFNEAVSGKPVVVDNRLSNKKVVMVNYDKYMDMLEIMAEINDEGLNKQLEASYREYEKGNYETGLEGLIDIVNEKRKKELLKD